MASYDITLEWVGGPTRTVDISERETVLEAARQADAPLPYGCRTGACGTCVGRLLAVDRTASVDVDATEDPIDVADAFAYQREPRALKPRHRDDGYVLLCIATPETARRVAVGSQVQSELVDNPWK
ncbi:2Fe-2S iron-sulfur cluster-binding protein [Natronorubrum thiooxidans]|uniref:Ferredoxin n=1 Tax=Natronorubrum thiooxidans TaxID=308853 RepID=A0A1N7EVS6_9EURY|nr:2Fe-2S iron-sulfur cluster binding domain-containing protein [Natronorubrum thiooxidans]SIR92166.1 ferredoxin [Natronorubrum thiooxidans]